MNLGQVLKKYRESEKIGLRELARRMDVDPSALLRVERGSLPAKKPFVRMLVWLFEDKETK